MRAAFPNLRERGDFCAEKSFRGELLKNFSINFLTFGDQKEP